MPSAADYPHPRQDTGLTPRSMEQPSYPCPAAGRRATSSRKTTGAPVGMGRLIGDGGWYFHVVDMAVVSAHQRRGIGDAVLSWLLDQVRERAPSDAFVSLMADPPGRRLYARHGFTEQRELSIGMALWLGREGDDLGAGSR